MARFEFKLPDIGEGVAEGELVGWHVKPGDAVKEDQAMLDVMTDKATVTIGAPVKGTIRETLAEVGAVVPVGTLLVVIETEGGASAAAPAPSRAPEPARPAPSSSAPLPAPAASAKSAPAASTGAEGPAATAVGDIKDTVPGGSFFASPAPTSPAAASPTPAPLAASPARPAPASAVDDGYHEERPLATPVVRKLARELGVDLRKVRPSGEGHRVTQGDVRAYQSRASAPVATSPQAASSASGSRAGLGRAPIAISPPPGTPASLEERRPFVGMRRKIAERMHASKTTAAHFTFVEECDVGRLKALRERMKPAAERQGVKLTFLPFIVKAVVAALKRFPVLNSALDETTNELVTRRYYHIGIAASTDQGLMVPVVKDADRKSLLEVAEDIERLGQAAKAGKIEAADLSGSTFTITSLGTQGGLFATPVLNFPEVGILGVHQIKKRPVVRDDQIVIGEIMLLSLSFDHRIVDGHVGAAFAYEVIQNLEDPEALFLGMA